MRLSMLGGGEGFFQEFECGIVVGGIDGCKNDNTDGVLCDVIA